MNFSRRGEVCPVRASGILGIVLHAASRETNVDLRAKSLNGKDEKWTSKTFTKTCVRRWHRFIFALQRIGFAWTTASEWKLASQDPILPLLGKKLDGNSFYNLKLRLQRKYLRNRRVVSGLFLAHGAANLHMCAWLFELAFESKLIVFVNNLECKQS